MRGMVVLVEDLSQLAVVVLHTMTLIYYHILPPNLRKPFHNRKINFEGKLEIFWDSNPKSTTILECMVASVRECLPLLKGVRIRCHFHTYHCFHTIVCSSEKQHSVI